MTENLPALIDRAAAALAGAHTAAQVLDAKDKAGFAYDAAKRAARIAKVRGAHDELIAAAHRAQADALTIEAVAQRRLADEYDAAQQRGEVATRQIHPGSVGHLPDGKMPATTADLGLTHKDVHDAREVRDAEAAQPGIVARTLQAQLDAGEEPNRAALNMAIKRAAKAVRAEEQERRDAQRTRMREARKAEIGGQGCTVDDLHALAATGQRFAVIYADPPWEFRVYSGKGKERSAERHYDTQGLDAIKALPVERLAAPDCALLLWAVMPELPGALAVIEAWGFTYKTAGLVWIKQNRSGEGLFTGMGYWTRANAELCLLATRGSPQRIARDVPQIIMAPVAEHSRKPAEARNRIERLLSGPYLELYGRQNVPGWTVWGDEIDRTTLHEAAE